MVAMANKRTKLNQNELNQLSRLCKQLNNRAATKSKTFSQFQHTTAKTIQNSANKEFNERNEREKLYQPIIRLVVRLTTGTLER